MRKITILFALVLGVSSAIYAEKGFGSDFISTPMKSEKVVINKCKAEAAKYYIKATQSSNNNVERIDNMLKSLAYDPSSKSALSYLDEYHMNHLELREQIVLGVYEIVLANPDNLKVVYFYANLVGSIDDDILDRVLNATHDIYSLSNDDARTLWILLDMKLQRLFYQKKYDEINNYLKQFLKYKDCPKYSFLSEIGAVFYYQLSLCANDERGWFGIKSSKSQKFAAKSADLADKISKDITNISHENDVLYRLKTFCQIGRTQDGITFAKNCLESDPTDNGMKAILGDAYFYAEEYDKVFPLFESIIADQEGNSYLENFLGEVAFYNKDYKRAEKYLRKVIEYSNGNAIATHNLIMVLINSGRYDEAQKVIDSAEEGLMVNLYGAILANAKGTGAKYLAKLKLAEEKAEDREVKHDIYYAMIVLGEEMRSVEIIKYCKKQYEELDMLKEPDIANAIGYIYAVLDVELDDAQSLVESALEMKPNNPVYLDSLAYIYYKKGEYKKAEKWINMSIAAACFFPYIKGAMYEHAGDIALKLGKKEQAKEYYTKVFKYEYDTQVNIENVKAKLEKIK